MILKSANDVFQNLQIPWNSVNMLLNAAKDVLF